MPVTKIPVQTHILRLMCEKCGTEMVSEGPPLLTEPVRYQYVCPDPECGHKELTFSAFPTIEYEAAGDPVPYEIEGVEGASVEEPKPKPKPKTKSKPVSEDKVEATKVPPVIAVSNDNLEASVFSVNGEVRKVAVCDKQAQSVVLNAERVRHFEEQLAKNPKLTEAQYSKKFKWTIDHTTATVGLQIKATGGGG